MKELKEQCLLRAFVLCQCCRFCDVSVQWCFFFFTLPFGLTASFWYPMYHHQCAHWEFSFQQRSLRPYFDPVFRGRFRLGIVLRVRMHLEAQMQNYIPAVSFSESPSLQPHWLYIHIWYMSTVTVLHVCVYKVSPGGAAMLQCAGDSLQN